MKYLFTLYLLISSSICTAQKGELFKKYVFKNFTVETDSCNYGAKIKLFRNSKVIYQNCFADAFRINKVDTIDLNKDKLLDFVFTLQSDDYSTLDILLSNTNPIFYKSFHITDITSAELYNSIHLRKDESIEDFIITKPFKNGERRIITNIILRRKQVIPLKNFSQTFTTNEIKKKMKQR